ncbi:hypothetical protein [Nocardia stercoris]|uniref:hypothetical protein n=1 Tax=Nocardia stercoris TaxID=2483361 RepID=UPI001F436FF0|nr:hypothetical protein [Nocardia stercoris]
MISPATTSKAQVATAAVVDLVRTFRAPEVHRGNRVESAPAKDLQALGIMLAAAAARELVSRRAYAPMVHYAAAAAPALPTMTVVPGPGRVRSRGRWIRRAATVAAAAVAVTKVRAVLADNDRSIRAELDPDGDFR